MAAKMQNKTYFFLIFDKNQKGSLLLAALKKLAKF